MSNSKKVLITLFIIGLLTFFVTAGTFATFSAQTDNPNNTFSSGTLVLSNTKTGGTTCYSTGGGNTDTNINNACDTLFAATLRKPGDTATQTLTLKNEGSLPASVFKVFSSTCTSADNPSESYHGTGNLCTGVLLYIQQYSDAAFTTPSACIYGGATTPGVCDFTDSTKTLAAFQTAYNSVTNGLAIGSGLANGTPAYFKVGINLPTSANNSFQGRKATFDFSWYIAQ